MSKVYKLPNITINDMIKILSELPEEAKSMKIDHICGCRDCETPGFQFTLLDENNENHNKYVLVPRYTDEEMHDSFGKRSLN